MNIKMSEEGNAVNYQINVYKMCLEQKLVAIFRIRKRDTLEHFTPFAQHISHLLTTNTSFTNQSEKKPFFDRASLICHYDDYLQLYKLDSDGRFSCSQIWH